jgi:ABC-type lipoprotein export system ATPase subunit
MGLKCHRLGFDREVSGQDRAPILLQVDAAFENGRMTLVTGSTGVGKSTLLHLLGGLLRPTSGEVRADGQPVSRWAAVHRDRWRRQVGMVFQHMHLLLALSVLENILLPVVPLKTKWEQLQNRVHTLLLQLGLNGLADEKVVRLSGGQRQRVAVARALVHRPRFLLLDEPTAFQDDRFTASLLDIWQTAAHKGACVVICSHDARLTASGCFHQRYHLEQGHLERLS